MIALIWLAMSFLAGRRLFNLLIGDPAGLLRPDPGSPWPEALFRGAAGLWLGLLPLTWLTYGLAALFNVFLPPAIHPLIAANALILVALAIWLGWPVLRKSIANIRCDHDPTRPRWARYEKQKPGGWVSLARSFRDSRSLIYIAAMIIWLLLALQLMNGTFWRDGTIYRQHRAE